MFVHVRVRLWVFPSLSPSHLHVSYLCQFPHVSFFPCSYCVSGGVKECVHLKGSMMGQRAGRSKWGQGRSRGRAKSFRVLTKAKGEQSWPATGKFGKDWEVKGETKVGAGNYAAHHTPTLSQCSSAHQPGSLEAPAGLSQAVAVGCCGRTGKVAALSSLALGRQMMQSKQNHLAWAVWLTGSWCSGRVSGLSLWGGRAKLRTLNHQRPPNPTPT